MDSAQLDTPPATPLPPASAESGRVIAERYRLIKKLGEGAMGAVFLAEHVHMRKRFALKILLPEAMASPEIVARFEREAIAAGNIEHPGVCAATDFGRLDDGGFFLVLEYVDGKSLRAIVREEGAMAPARACGIVRQILAALAAAHAKGVVHRDMKPENVMISGDDVVKVLDFGIAKVDANTLGEGQGTNLTRMGAIYGTPVYMAPEQAMGKAIDARVDLYAVGVMLHEMITGKPPFDGDGIVLLAKHVNDPPPPLVSPRDPNAVTGELRAFVERLLAKDPKDRPEDANRTIAELDQARASLATFNPAAIATNPTVMGETSILTGRPLPQAPLADAATVYGDASPPPPSIATSRPSTNDRLGELRDRAFTKLTPLAKRVGVDVKHLAVGIACLAGVLVILVMVLAFSGGKKDDEEDEERRPRKRPVATSQAPSSTTAATTPKDDDPSKSGSAPAATGSSSGKGGGGGIKGLGRKIKSLF